MKDEIEGQPWFGEFGISTSLLINNFEIYLNLSLLLLKAYFFRFLMRSLFSLAIRKILNTNFNILEIFIAEAVPAIPFMVISALTSLLNFNMTSFDEKLNIMGQISTLFFCIAIIFLNYVFKTSNLTDKSKR